MTTVAADIADPTVATGKVLMTLSCGQLLQRDDLVVQARQTGAAGALISEVQRSARHRQSPGTR